MKIELFCKNVTRSDFQKFQDYFAIDIRLTLVYLDKICENANTNTYTKRKIPIRKNVQ